LVFIEFSWIFIENHRFSRADRTYSPPFLRADARRQCWPARVAGKAGWQGWLAKLAGKTRWQDQLARLAGKAWLANLAGRAGWRGWLARLVGKAGRQGWPAKLAGKAGWQGWLARLTGKAGWQSWLAGWLVGFDRFYIGDFHFHFGIIVLSSSVSSRQFTTEKCRFLISTFLYIFLHFCLHFSTFLRNVEKCRKM
jgi:hypothetical protein